MHLLLRTDAKVLSDASYLKTHLVRSLSDGQDWMPIFAFVQPGPQHPFTVQTSQNTRRTCDLPEIERSWAPVHHAKFTMTTTHFDQLQLAERWRLSPKTLERWRVIRTGSQCIRLPGKVIYRLCDIKTDENECLVSSTTEFYKHTKLFGQPLVVERC